MSGPDPLFGVKNAFYLGNYQSCISEAQNVRSTDADVKTTAECFLYRSYIAQKKYRIALDEISGGSSAELQAVRLYADYLANADKRLKILEQIPKKDDANPMFLLMAAQIYMREGDFDSALRVLHSSEALEARALGVQCLLKLHRADLALKEVKKMQETDEDATVTQLAQAWTNIYLGRDKLQDAYYILQEMLDKYGQTALLLCAQASILCLQAKHEQADELLQEALQKDPNSAEALVNMIVVSQQLGKPLEQCNRYISQLTESHPDHPWTRQYLATAQRFDALTESAA